jgi:hypothetical protein
MKKILQACAVSMICLPLFASADVASTTMPVPVHVSPINNAVFTTSLFTNVDWSDVSLGSTTLFYNYELSSSSLLLVDGSFATPFATSSLLASSSMPAVGTAEGVYYWHVRSVDASSTKSVWSSASKVTVDNTIPSAPSALTLTSSVSPIISGTTTVNNGSQTWLFTPSVDTLSGVAKYQYNLSGTSTWTDIGLATSFVTTLPLGSRYVSVRAFDVAGNMSTSTSAAVTITASSTSATSTLYVPSSINQCKKSGWRSFAGALFKNQGRCVSYIEKSLRDKKKEEQRSKIENKKKQEEAHKVLKKYDNDQKKAVESIMKKMKENRSEDNEHQNMSSSSSKFHNLFKKNNSSNEENEHSNKGGKRG